MRGAAELEQLVRDGGLLAADGSPLLLLCSAGRDSAALLQLAVRIHGPDGVVVLHVDHGLRAASAEEARLVEQWGRDAGVPVVVRRADASGLVAGGSWVNATSNSDVKPTHGAGAPRGVQAWARGERQRLAAEEAARVGAARVATAHTQSDLVEGALFRLATQPGRRALLGLRAERELMVGDAPTGRRLVRPLLGITRPETLAYGRELGLLWRDDPSNADPRFARARLRTSVMPVLRALNPRADATIARTIAELAEEHEALQSIVEAALPNTPGEIPVAALAALPLPVARLVLREVCERWLGAPCPRAAARTAELLALASASAAPVALDIGDGVRLAVRRGVVRCEHSSGPAAPSAR